MTAAFPNPLPRVIRLSPGLRVGYCGVSGFASVGVPAINEMNRLQSKPSYRVVAGLAATFRVRARRSGPVMRKWLMIAAVAVWCCHAGGAAAHSHRQKGFEIVHPWCFATADAAATTTAVYMLIKNRGRRPDRLIGATSPAARTIELRAPAAASGDETRVVAAVALPGGREVALKRTGPHLVLSGLDKPLAPYESFAMTLIFKRAGRIDIEVVVEEAAVSARQ